MYLGANVDFWIYPETAVSDYAALYGQDVASYGCWIHFPLRPSDIEFLEGYTDQVEPTGGIAFITLEPYDGLDQVTQAAVDDFAQRVVSYEQRGMSVMVRFAHEMNGSWYPWGQQPIEYRAKFRLLADAIHAVTTRTAMVWAPHEGAGYAFQGGPYKPPPGST